MAAGHDARHESATGHPLSGRVSRYDLLLAFLPTLFVVALLVGHLLSVPPRTTLGVASVFGAFAVADGMFWNPPLSGVGRGDRDE